MGSKNGWNRRGKKKDNRLIGNLGESGI